MTCPHVRIIVWRDAQTGHAVPLWSCADCGRRFAPLSDEASEKALEREKELVRLRDLARKAGREVGPS